MSTTPSSAPRRSSSSQPSATSSATIHSGYSSIPHLDHGDPGSSKRRRVSVQTDGTLSAHGAARSSGLLGADLAAERDNDGRKHRLRRSGGFLLGSALPRDAGRRHSTQSDDKGRLSIFSRRRKSKSPGVHDTSRRPHSGASSERSYPSTSGDGDAPLAGNTWASPPRSQRSMERSPRQPQGFAGLGIDVGSSEAGDGHLEPEEPQVMPGIDPTQIVHMALNLSESRRRHLNYGQLVAPSVPGSRRATSAGMPLSGTPMHGSFHESGFGGSLKQHLQQQRQVSFNLSPRASMQSPASRHVSLSSPSGRVDSALGPQHSYQFSAATLARADKARAYIDLSMEYLRLLSYLQPLKPNPEAPGNYTYTTTNVPGTPIVDIKRTITNPGLECPLGRSYNPLQFIRNRKLRARERRQLDPDVRDFEDVDRVKDWIDDVAEASEDRTFRREDNVLLPPFDDGIEQQDTEHQPGQNPKQSLLLGKTKRPRMDWFVLPTELLADAVWLEQNSHKGLIEDRHGNRIFPSRSRSVGQPRVSRDLQRRSLDHRRRLSTAGSDAAHSEAHTADSSEAGSHRGRRKLGLFHSHRDDSTDRRKHGWRSRGRSTSSSDLSSSDDDMSTRKKKRDRRLTDHEENTGPLERHMKEMLNNEAFAEENQLSPILSSPDKWGADQARRIPGRRIRSGTEQSDRDGDSDRGQARRSRRVSKLSEKSLALPRTSMDGLDSSAPNTPLSNTFSFAASSPPSRHASPERKSRRSKFPFFRSDDSHKGHKVDTTDFAHDQGSSLSLRHVTSEPSEPGRISLDQTRPANLLRSRKTNESLSSLASIQEGKEDLSSRERKQKKEPKEPGSAVSRFFKDVRKEGSKVGELIFKKDRLPEEADEKASSEETDTSSSSSSNEDMMKSIIKSRPKPIQRTTADSMVSEGSDGGRKPKYHVDLPSFKSTIAQDQEQDSDTAISGREEGRRGRRSARFDRLAPPRLDLSTVSPSSSETPGSGRSRSPSAIRARMNKLLEVPGGVGRAGLPVSALTRISPADKDSPVRGRRSGDTSRTPSRPSLSRHRQWSISDQGIRRPSAPNVTITVTPADIARVRALLYCSGIKAREISRRAHETRDAPPVFLASAAEITGAHLVEVPRKEEHVLAARILSSELENTNQELVAGAERFRHEAVRALHARCEEVRIRVGERLTPRVHACADEADAFTRELTSGATLAVKAVVDRVEMMSRARRRRMWWLRRMGWMVLEWMVLALMWWVWLVVVVVRLVLGAGRGAWRGVKWFLWLE
ncbi:uncharacterized protein K452DRAFT_229575 [Aplosporella prunicola CBS 121167]|uniref:Uncharacterized protein n=1 Tax=Aplosporella prunicola CBS 121167 TaxID=1176127 RepID=A0A6A6BC61_9PEZI|nr:uncharacterized protein K452DRAFT_229575 [Aplosporella prunicola CBS 121167]KAF2140834.1 hypothetical protein K452DRAFT_229575 [Aplosporella prunicola CBS 121167]